MQISKLVAASLSDDLSRMAGIANNLANLSTPAYKSTIHISPTFEVELSRADADGGVFAAARQLSAAQASLDPRHGALRPTGYARDVALEGEGFFQVVASNGPAYVRQASLRIDTQGRLVNQAGLPMMVNGGELRLLPKDFDVRPSGEIVQDGQVAGRLSVVAPVQAGRIEALGDGTYRLAGDTRPVDHASVKSGFSEASNVEASREMTRMLETVRHFEALHKVVLAYGDLNEKAAHHLGEF